MATDRYTIDWTPWTEPVTGEWCDRCYLPSVVVVEWVVSLGLETVGVDRWRCCDTCGLIITELVT